MSIVCRAGACTDVGRVRANNEDAHRLDGPVFAVADGMGGHAAGEVASAMAIASFDGFEGATSTDVPSVLGAVARANEEILRSADADAALTGMGTTIAGVALTREGTVDRMLVFNVGDSRVYRWRTAELVQISEDHSALADIEASDGSGRRLTRRVITRALGVEHDIPIDVWMLEVIVGDRLVLCSDGLTNEVPDESLQRLLGEIVDPQRAADALVGAALEAGGRDNVTAVVVDVVGVDAVVDAVDSDTAPRASVSSARTKR